MRTGRNRKPNVMRDKTGKSRGEKEIVDPRSIAIRAREIQKDGLKPEDAHDALAGYTLGRLLLRARADPSDPGSISEAQYDAGQEWQRTVHRHAAIMGYKLNIKSPANVMVSQGIDCRAEPKASEIRDVREKFTRSYNALGAESRIHGIRLMHVVYGVCVENWPVSALSEADFGLLRTGLNAIAKVI